MTIRWAVRAFSLAAAALLAIGIHGQTGMQTVTVSTHVPQELVQLENEWLHAKDNATVDHIIADDFVGIGVLGTSESKLDRVSRFRPGPTPPAASDRFEDLKVRYYGEIGIVNGRLVGAYQDGRTAYEVRFTDVFHYRNGRWMAISAQEDFVVIH